MRLVRIGIRIHNSNIRCLKIAFLIIRVNFQRLFLLARINQLPYQPPEQIVFQRQFLCRTAYDILTLQIQYRQRFFIDEKNFVFAV